MDRTRGAAPGKVRSLRHAVIERAESVARPASSRSHRAQAGGSARQLSLLRLVDDVRPHELYNPAAMSFVPASWDQLMLTASSTPGGDASARLGPPCGSVDPLHQASSSEMSKVRQCRERADAVYPRSPYGVSKVFGHYITVNYREATIFCGLRHAVQPRTPRRGLEFVTRRCPTAWPGSARPRRQPLDRQSGRAARLGLCRRLCPHDVADAAAGPSRRLRDRYR